jgi:hypothetical protein
VFCILDVGSALWVRRLAPLFVVLEQGAQVENFACVDHRLLVLVARERAGRGLILNWSRGVDSLFYGVWTRFCI